MGKMTDLARDRQCELRLDGWEEFITA